MHRSDPIAYSNCSSIFTPVRCKQTTEGRNQCQATCVLDSLDHSTRPLIWGIPRTSQRSQMIPGPTATRPPPCWLRFPHPAKLWSMSQHTGSQKTTTVFWSTRLNQLSALPSQAFTRYPLVPLDVESVSETPPTEFLQQGWNIKILSSPKMCLASFTTIPTLSLSLRGGYDPHVVT